MAESATEKAALDYLARGWSVIPAREKAKRPAIAWKAYQRQCATEKTVREWFRRSAEYNVSVVTGALSGLVVMDVDPRHGGRESLRMLEREHGPLPQTVESITGGGGRHVYFTHPGGRVP
ncbi:MAG: bifunctional DNA primase/polymerase, partial [Gammaproteobacteria bacterium]